MKVDADAELLKLSRIREEQAVTVVREAHGAPNTRSWHGNEVHVQHGPQGGNAVGFDVAVGRVADQAWSVPDVKKNRGSEWRTFDLGALKYINAIVP